MTRFPRFLGPGWLLAYAVSGCLWLAIFGFTPLPFVLTFAALGLLGMYQLGSWIMGGSPPENR
jgi:hypothetical protein